MALAVVLMFSSFIILSMGQEPFLPNAMVMPVTKDSLTLQYVAEVKIGEPLSPVKLGIDLSGKNLWLDCDSVIPSSSQSQYAVGCCSTQCSMGKSDCRCRRDSKSNELCAVQLENPITGMVSFGDLIEGIVAAEVTDGLKKTGSLATIPEFLISCAAEEKSLLKGLPREVKGILGIGNTRVAFPSQVSAKFRFQRKFSLCLSSSNGVIIFGESPHLEGEDISRSLLYTPLTYHQGEINSQGYYINVRSIKINSKKLSTSTKFLLSVNEEGHGGTRISTTVPYTTMESKLFAIFTDAYIRTAMEMNITRVPSPMAPFEVCFSSKGVEKTSGVGPKVPTIELVLQSEMVKWKIVGRNSMVDVNEEVMCLGILDGRKGGLSSGKASIVIGSHQLEERFLEFNLGNSMLGFSSSSLLMKQRSCSEFRSNSIATF